MLFSFQITIKLEQDQDKVRQDELDFFIKVGIYSSFSQVASYDENNACFRNALNVLMQPVYALIDEYTSKMWNYFTAVTKSKSKIRKIAFLKVF